MLSLNETISLITLAKQLADKAVDEPHKVMVLSDLLQSTLDYVTHDKKIKEYCEAYKEFKALARHCIDGESHDIQDEVILK